MGIQQKIKKKPGKKYAGLWWRLALAHTFSQTVLLLVIFYSFNVSDTQIIPCKIN